MYLNDCILWGDPDTQPDIQRLRQLFDAGADPMAFDAFTFVIAHCPDEEVIAEFVLRGAPADSRALCRAITWENASAMRVLMDACTIEHITQAFRLVAWRVALLEGYIDEKTCRAMVFHPRVSTFSIDSLKKVVPTEFWHVLEDLENQRSKIRTMERTEIIKEELIQAAWHPKRHVAWCLGELYPELKLHG
jgi:hypothetical protein